MKPINRYLKSSLFGATFLALLFLFFSCSPEPDLEADSLEATNGRSKNKNDGKSANAVLKTLAKGSVPGMSNGIDVGPDGFLYAGSVVEQTINVINKNNGKIVNRISERVTGPDDLVFGPNGSPYEGALYWTDILTGEVGRLDPGETTPVKQSFAPGVNPIAFNDEGRLFVALDFQGDGLYEFDPELAAPPRPIIECPSYLETGVPCLGFFNSFDFGPDGRLYGPLFAFNLVIAVDVGEPDDPPLTGDLFGDQFGGAVEILAGGGGEFSNPAAAKFGPDGLLYILDQSGKLFTLDIDTRELKTITESLGPGLDNMVFDADGSLYMTNNDEGWVAEILLPSGQARILSPGGMIAPQGLAILAGPNNQDLVFEADLFSMRAFNGSSGRQTGRYKGAIVPGPGSLTLPQNVSASGNDLVIASFFSSNVQVWNPQDGVIDDFEEQVFAPLAAVRLNSGAVIVSDIARLGPASGGGVFRMNEADPILEFPGVASSLATDGEKVWATDWGAGLIIEIDFITEPPTIDFVVSGLSFPEGIAVDNEGRLLVYETSGPGPGVTGKLTRINLETGEQTTLVEGLKPKEGGILGFPPQWILDNVAVGPSGDIYITGGASNSILKIPQNKVP